jgi:hypothetical protein
MACRWFAMKDKRHSQKRKNPLDRQMIGLFAEHFSDDKNENSAAQSAAK